MKIITLFALFLLPSRLLYCEDWTIGYKTYHNVIVTKVTDDHVEITFDGGLGGPRLSTLSPDLQKRFNYDPVKARTAIDAKIKAQQTASVVHYSEATNLAPVKPQIDVGAIQSQIQALQSDINEKQREVDKYQRSEATGGITSQNAYRDIIAQEKSEMAQLQATLASH